MYGFGGFCRLLQTFSTSSTSKLNLCNNQKKTVSCTFFDFVYAFGPSARTLLAICVGALRLFGIDIWQGRKASSRVVVAQMCLLVVPGAPCRL